MSYPAITITHAVPLASLTTLKVGGEAAHYCEAETSVAIGAAISYAIEQSLPWRVIGGGSNILASDEGFPGLVIKVCTRGVTVLTHRDNEVEVRVAAGEMLDDFVAHCVAQNWWGVENLSAIPGTVGATPVQNVGAYGVEVADRIKSVSVYDVAAGTVRELAPEDCEFEYRSSIFKRYPNRFVILDVTFQLSLLPNPQCAYADLARHFTHDANPSLTAIREAVMMIRSGKFPDWRVVGTAGSFFKNPTIKKSVALALQEQYPELPCYPAGENNCKVSLAYILDKVCGLKGYQSGSVRLYEKQPLVLVIEGAATAAMVNEFADAVAAVVFEKTGIQIEREVTTL